MYLCNGCKEKFRHFNVVKEPHPELWGNFFEFFYECPNCGSMDFDEERQEETDD